MNAKLDSYFQNAKQWRTELKELRRIVLDCGLDEELKWHQPCYIHAGRNIAILQSFKNQCALMFFQGALLKDPKGLLEPPGPNSNIARRMVFSSVDEVRKSEKHIRAFVKAAIRIEEQGQKAEVEHGGDTLPAELEAMFKKVRGLKRAFQALTPGRQRAYVLHFSGAKQAATRHSRVEKCIPQILAGKGLRDQNDR